MDDLALLESVPDDVFDDPIHRQATVNFLSDKQHHLVVAIKRDRIIGFATALQYFHPDKAAPEFWINEVGVAAKYRGQGVATAIMKHVRKIAVELGCVEAWVLTHRDNIAAMNLYASMSGGKSEDTVMFTFRLTNREDET